MTTTAGADPFADLGPEVGRDPWEDRVPLHAVVVPSFPEDVLPPWLDRFASALSCALQVPRDLPALLALATASAAVAGKAVLEIKPRYREPLNLWVVAPLRSGAGKSATVRALTAPIGEWQRDWALAMRDEIAEAASRVRIRESARQKAERAAGAAEGAERLRLEADALESARDVAALSVPRPPRLLADDVTAERLATLLMEHEGRMAIISPEGDVFDLMGGRYSNNIPNIGVYLRAHTGDRIIVDRTGREPDFVETPALTMGISPQPDVLRGLTQKPGFRGRGLLARFLYSLPRSLVGERHWDAEPLSDEEAERYGTRLRALLDLCGARCTEPLCLQLAPRARAQWRRFQDSLEPRLGPRGDLAALDDWGCKLAGHAARIAGVLHLAAVVASGTAPVRADVPLVVGEDSMRAALRLADYFVPHARAAFAAMGADATIEEAGHILLWLATQQKEEFTKRECWRAMRGHLERAEDLDAPLARLCAHGYIRARGQPKAERGPGKPLGPAFEVNPLARPHLEGDIGHIGHIGHHVLDKKNGHDAAEEAPGAQWIPL